MPKQPPMKPLCENCNVYPGAVIDLTEDSKCRYCGRVIGSPMKPLATEGWEVIIKYIVSAPWISPPLNTIAGEQRDTMMRWQKKKIEKLLSSQREALREKVEEMRKNLVVETKTTSPCNPRCHNLVIDAVLSLLTEEK